MTRKLEYLQIARAIAAIIVVCHHIGDASFYYFKSIYLSNIFAGGWSGVDFFFVLSGFIIYMVHAPDIGKSKLFSNYIYKRFTRIYPIYWIIASVALLAMLVSTKNVSNGHLAARLFDLEYLIKSYVLFPQAQSPFLGVAWSLCYEVFFYLIFGVVILLGWKKALPFIIALLLFAKFQDNYLSDFISSNYHIEFILGVLTGYLFRLYQANQNVIIEKQYFKIIAIGGVTLFCIGWGLTLNFETIFSRSSIYSRLIYGFASVLILISISNLELVRSRFSKFSLLIGDSSYVLYLIHPLVISISYKLLSKYISANATLTTLIGILVLVFSIITGLIVHLYIEKPILIYFSNRIKREKQN